MSDWEYGRISREEQMPPCPECDSPFVVRSRNRRPDAWYFCLKCHIHFVAHRKPEPITRQALREALAKRRWN